MGISKIDLAQHLAKRLNGVSQMMHRRFVVAHAYLVLREPAFVLRTSAGKPISGLPHEAAGEVGFFDKFSSGAILNGRGRRAESGLVETRACSSAG